MMRSTLVAFRQKHRRYSKNGRFWLPIVAAAATTTTTATTLQVHRHYTRTDPAPQEDKKGNKHHHHKEQKFDVTKLIATDSQKLLERFGFGSDQEETNKQEGQAQEKLTSDSFLSKVKSIVKDTKDIVKDTLSTSLPASDDGDTKQPPDTSKELQNTEQSVSDTILTFFTGTTNKDANTIDNFVQQARNLSEQGQVTDKSSLSTLMNIMETVRNDLYSTIESVKGEAGMETLPIILPSALFYYLEHEESIKTPSWKRRKHRFCPGINVEDVDELNYKLELSKLSYVDSVSEIQTRLSQEFNLELVYCNLESLPGQPSHFIAVHRGDANGSSSSSSSLSSLWPITRNNDTLEVTLVVRGTKTLTDVMTDIICEAVDYQSGKAHSGILTSGKFLATKHLPMFQQLLKLSGKKRMKVNLIGHSLGAGAASIMGMELHNQQIPNVEVNVTGFGCPALLSKDLSEQTKTFITTVVADCDCVPRMSIGTMVNTYFNLAEFDWRPMAQRDIMDVIDQMQQSFPILLSIVKSGGNNNDNDLNDTVKTILERSLQDLIVTTKQPRMEPILFPPGDCIHFYRDGSGITGSHVPCDFFDQVDISRTMVDDHLFHTGYVKLFLDLMRQHHQDHFFRFDNVKKGQ